MQRGVTIMTDKILDNNQVSVFGEVISSFSFSHEVFGEGFYLVTSPQLWPGSEVIIQNGKSRILEAKEP